MTAPTHVAFAIALGQFFGVRTGYLSMLAIGALLPDLDHPKSSIGRILYFISIPLNQQFGHRKAVHGFAIWTAVSFLGIWWKPAQLFGLGALSHILLDCWNVSGVQAFEPFSEKVCVLFSRTARIVTGSRKELGFLVVFLLCIWFGGWINTIGGVRSFISTLLGSYKIAIEEYVTEGTKKCYMSGKLRYPDGTIKTGEWLIVGLEGKSLAILEDDKILHIPKDAQFLKAKLNTTDTDWKTMQLSGIAETETDIFMFSKTKGKWIFVKSGSFVSGYIIGDEINLNTKSGF